MMHLTKYGILARSPYCGWLSADSTPRTGTGVQPQPRFGQRLAAKHGVAGHLMLQGRSRLPDSLNTTVVQPAEQLRPEEATVETSRRLDVAKEQEAGTFHFPLFPSSSPHSTANPVRASISMPVPGASVAPPKLWATWWTECPEGPRRLP